MLKSIGKERKTLRPPFLSFMFYCLPRDPKSSLIWQLHPRPYNGYLERGFDPIIIKLLLTGSVLNNETYSTIFLKGGTTSFG